MIITFASSKGGVGKSTACACIAAALAMRGDETLVLDLDQNRTLATWAKTAKAANTALPNLTIIAPDPADFAQVMREKQAAFQHILIDLPGTREITLMKALARSNLVIIPAQPSQPDLKEACVIVSDLRDIAETQGRSIPYRLLLTKVFPLRTKVTDHIFLEITRLMLQRFQTCLVERSSYKELFLHGQSPLVTEPGKGGGTEIAGLLAEIESVLVAENSAHPLAEAV